MSSCHIHYCKFYFTWARASTTIVPMGLHKNKSGTNFKIKHITFYFSFCAGYNLNRNLLLIWVIYSIRFSIKTRLWSLERSIHIWAFTSSHQFLQTWHTLNELSKYTLTFILILEFMYFWRRRRRKYIVHANKNGKKLCAPIPTNAKTNYLQKFETFHNWQHHNGHGRCNVVPAGRY